MFNHCISLQGKAAVLSGTRIWLLLHRDLLSFTQLQSLTAPSCCWSVHWLFPLCGMLFPQIMTWLQFNLLQVSNATFSMTATPPTPKFPYTLLHLFFFLTEVALANHSLLVTKISPFSHILRYWFITNIAHCLSFCYNVNSMRNGVFKSVPTIFQAPRTTR